MAVAGAAEEVFTVVDSMAAEASVGAEEALVMRAGLAVEEGGLVVAVDGLEATEEEVTVVATDAVMVEAMVAVMDTAAMGMAHTDGHGGAMVWVTMMATAMVTMATATVIMMLTATLCAGRNLT